jgi:hypothetical protein
MDAFLFDRLHGLVELLESDRPSRDNWIPERPQQVPALLRDYDVEAVRARVFTKLFPLLRETDPRSGQLEVTQG